MRKRRARIREEEKGGDAIMEYELTARVTQPKMDNKKAEQNQLTRCIQMICDQLK